MDGGCRRKTASVAVHSTGWLKNRTFLKSGSPVYDDAERRSMYLERTGHLMYGMSFRVVVGITKVKNSLFLVHPVSRCTGVLP